MLVVEAVQQEQPSVQVALAAAGQVAMEALTAASVQ
jgi:hypothetical protein